MEQINANDYGDRKVATYDCTTSIDGIVTVVSLTTASVEEIKALAARKHGCVILDVVAEHVHAQTPRSRKQKHLGDGDEN